MKEKISDDIDIELCTVAAKYCDDLLPEDNYVLEDHEELWKKKHNNRFTNSIPSANWSCADLFKIQPKK